jgi:hypothetical protein
VLADGPYAYLTLGDGGGNVAQDLSGNGRNGVYVGAPLLTNDGPFGAGSSALTIGASGQYVDMNATLVPTTGNWTVEAWVYSSGAGFGDGSPVWSQYHNTFSRRTSAQVQPSTGAVGMQIGSSSAWPVNQVSTDTWTHVAWRRSGSTVSIHANGQVVGSFLTGTNVDSKETWIGAHQGQYSTAYFNGRLAEVSVIRTALTDARIQEHYESAVPSTPAGPGTPLDYKAMVLSDEPVAYYPLDEVAGPIAMDHSGVRQASIIGLAQTGAEGPFGPGSRSISFTGPGQRVEAPDALVPATGDWTVEAWVAAHGPGFGDGNPIWSQYLTTGPTRTTAQVSGNTSPYAVGFQAGETKVSPPAQLNQDEWSYVVWRKTDTMVQIIVNGTVAGQLPIFGPLDPKNTWIGAHSASGWSTAGFNGRISQFAVYDRSLSNAALASHWTAAGRPAVTPFAGGPIGDQLRVLQAQVAKVAAMCEDPPANTISLEVELDLVGEQCILSGVAMTCQWVQFFCDHKEELIVGIAGVAVVLIAIPLVAAAGSSLAGYWASLGGWSSLLDDAALALAVPGGGSAGGGVAIVGGSALTVTVAGDLILRGPDSAISLTVSNTQAWLQNFSIDPGPIGGSDDGDLGEDWEARPASEIPGSSGCELCAEEEIMPRLGNKGNYRLITTEEGGPLAKYRGQWTEWYWHKVVEYNGRIYDAFTGRYGLPVNEWKALWTDAPGQTTKFGGL